MFIQNAVYKAVHTDGLTFPLAEGTVITVGDVTGIVPENIALAAPTGLIYLATGGTIDLTSEANAGVTFTDEQLKELGGDFNFIPLTEAGGSSLPSYTSADIGKVLTVGEDAEHSVSETIIEEQTFTTDGTSSAKATLTVDFTYEQASAYASAETDVIVVLDGNNIPTKFEWRVYGEQDRPVIYITDTAFIVWNGIAVQARQLSKNTTYTISVIRSIPSVEPKWENGGVTVTLPSDFITTFQTAMQSAITDILTNSRTGIVYAETSNFAGTGLADFVTEVKNAAAAALEMKTIWVKGITDEPIAAQYAQVLATGKIGLGFIVPSYEVGSPINRIFTIFIHVSGTVNGDGDITSVKARAGFQVWTSAS
jgi:hypothetical protein